jgi:hypothetical protein
MTTRRRGVNSERKNDPVRVLAILTVVDTVLSRVQDPGCRGRWVLRVSVR